LDEYVKNRDVWRCPSAKMTGGAMFIYGSPDWFGYLLANEGAWGTDDPDGICVKDGAFPQGWGGEVTDSIFQRRMASIYAGSNLREIQNKAFAQEYATNDTLYYTKMVEIQDPVSYVVCADGGACTDFMNIGTIAYPDICNANCANCGCSDWREPDCYLEQMNGCPECASLHARGGDDPETNFILNPELRKPYTRHLGGSNIGWADGHASWMLADAWLDKWADEARENNSTLGCGVYSWGPVSWCGIEDPTEPTLR
jgi:prepilin-type processing-associated H-X9-DG protein